MHHGLASSDSISRKFFNGRSLHHNWIVPNKSLGGDLGSSKKVARWCGSQPLAH